MVVVSIFIRDYQGDLMVDVMFETYLGEPRSPFDPSQQQRPPEDHGADARCAKYKTIRAQKDLQQ